MGHHTISFPFGIPAQKKVFWVPLAWAGLPHWELGWLWVYLLVYLPAMIAARWVLRVA